jgi:hypothetical protein
MTAAVVALFIYLGCRGREERGAVLCEAGCLDDWMFGWVGFDSESVMCCVIIKSCCRSRLYRSQVFEAPFLHGSWMTL